MLGKFEIMKAKDNEFYFNLKAANSQVILTGQMYSSKDSAKSGIESVKKSASADAQYERKTSPAGHSFVLKAANGEVIGRSEVYSTTGARDSGIESVKTNGHGAGIEDLS